MADKSEMVFGALVGSLRKGSINRKVAGNLQDLAPDGVRVEELPSIGEIPHFDEDVQNAGHPEAVLRMAEALRAVDALVIVTPEYNYSIPGVLKNAIDWMTRTRPQPFAGKPTAIVTASPGAYGGIRCQHQLRQVLVAVNAITLPRPEVHIPAADKKVDEAGHITDERTREFLGKLLAELANYVRRFS